MLRWDTLWQRPTRPLGGWGGLERGLRFRVQRDFAHGCGSGNETRTGADQGPLGPAPSRAAASAVRALALTPPVMFAEIKTRYRQLVKIHHPDANGGDKVAEERLKRINQAYTTLKALYGG